MLSIRQIRAARALLDWSQADLAKATGLHVNAINKIESAQGNPRAASLSRIRAACEVAGIQFQGQRGVMVREETFEVRRFEGEHHIRHLTNDMIAVLKRGDEVLSMIPQEADWDKIDAADNKRYQAARKKIGFTERTIIGQEQAHTAMPRACYRWLPAHLLGRMAYGLYQDRVCFIRLDKQETLMIRSASLADNFRAQFEFFWQQGRAFK